MTSRWGSRPIALTALTIASALALAASPRALASSWTIQPVPAPTAAQGHLAGVSCVIGTCIAVGSFVKTDGSQATLTESWNGTTWSRRSTPTPVGATQSALTAVSCATPSSCTAVGWYTSAAGSAPLAELWNGTSWSIAPISTPAGATAGEFNGVSCTAGVGSSAFCTAVGDWTSASGHAPLIESSNGTSWSVQGAKMPADAVDSYLNAVSCTVATSCKVVGYFVASDGSGSHPLTEALTAAGWTLQSSPQPSGVSGVDLDGVSCTSILACTAVGYAVGSGGATVPIAEQWNGTSWSLTTVPAGAGADSRLTGVSCTFPDACIAVGRAGLAERWNGSSWSVQSPGGAVRADFAADSCSFNGAATSCTAVGQLPSGGVTVAEGWDGSTWTLETTPDTGPGDAVLSGVSCAGATCTAVGYSVNSAGTQVPLAERWDGSSWTLQSVQMPAGATGGALQAVSCPTDTLCAAVGSVSTVTSTLATLAMRWNGATWTIQPTPNPVGATVAELSGVSCPGAGACMAVGSSGDGHTTSSLTELWSATGWTIVAAPATGNDALAAVSCPTASNCAAVGTSGGGAMVLAEGWNGGGWTVQPAVKPNGGAGTRLAGVSCTGAGSCIAAGSYGGPSTSSVLIERMSGASWQTQAAPNQPGSGSDLLLGTSCAADTACSAVGEFVAGSSVATLAERWNGAGWSIQGTPAPPGAGLAALNGVSCTTSQTCVAVGYSQQAVALPLAEVYSGPAAPGGVTPPAITGPLVAGHALTEQHGSFTDAPAAYAYQWRRCNRSGTGCAAIPGATSRTLALGGGDVGHTLRVQETAFNDGGPSAPLTSNATGVVQAAAHGGPPPGPTPTQIRAGLLGQITAGGTAARIAQLLAHDGIRLSFRALGAGRLLIHWWYRPRHGREILIGGAGRTFSAAGRTTVTLTLTAAGRRLLAPAQTLAVQARAEFFPSHAAGVVADRDFTLTR